MQNVVTTLKSLKPDDSVEKYRISVDLEKHRISVEVSIATACIIDIHLFQRYSFHIVSSILHRLKKDSKLSAMN